MPCMITSKINIAERKGDEENRREREYWKIVKNSDVFTVMLDRFFLIEFISVYQKKW